MTNKKKKNPFNVIKITKYVNTLSIQCGKCFQKSTQKHMTACGEIGNLCLKWLRDVLYVLDWVKSESLSDDNG